jgi:phosphatidylglycerophosphatase A
MNIKKLILSCFGVGFLPLMPGTWASLLLLAAFLVIHYFWPITVISIVFLVFVMVVSSVFCLLFAGEAEKLEDKKDPGWIVLDELAGEGLALLPVAVIGEKVLVAAIGGFVLFRIFDILKPPPIRECEQLKGACGILADDIVAGLMAGVSVQIVSYLFTFFQ